MKIVLKKIKVFEEMSEETTAFHAEIYINGVNAGYARNDGHGGDTDCYPHTGHRDLLSQAETFCQTLPDKDYGTFKVKMTLEGYIDSLLDAHILEKDCLTSICVGKVGRYEVLGWKGHTIASLKNRPDGVALLKKTVNQIKSEGKNILNKNLAEFGV